MERTLRVGEMGEETAGLTGAKSKNCNVVAIRKKEVVCFVVVGEISNRGFAIRNVRGFALRVRWGPRARNGDPGRVWVVVAAL